jgi:hypothetical protein
VAAITIPIISEYNDKGVKRAQKAFANLKKEAGSLGKAIKSAMLPAVAAVGALAAGSVAAVKAAVEDAASQEMLAKQLRNTTKATDAQIAANEKFIAGLEIATATADTELRPAMATLLRATRDTAKSQKLLRTAMDVSRATGRPLTRVVESIARAYGGNVLALARLDPSLRDFIDKTTTADQAMERLGRSVRGASDAYQSTLQGRLDLLKIQFENIIEQIGYALLPLFERFAAFLSNTLQPYVQKLADAFSEQGLSGVLKILGKDLFKSWQNAKGMNGALVDLAGTAALLFAVFRGAAIFTAFVATLKAAATAVSALGGAFTVFAGASTAAIVGAFALAAVAVLSVVAALRDPAFRTAFGEVLANSAKLIANAFIGMYKVIRFVLNQIIKVLRLLPGGKSFGFLPDVDFRQFTFDAGAPTFGTPRAFEQSAQNNVVINVNGGDPAAVVEQLRKYYRQNGPLPFATYTA